MVPIAPELKPILLRLFNAAAEGAEIVIPRLRDARVNLRTQFEKISGRAGATTWPRLFHNLRGSCATDWCERFPAHVVAGWLGHSPLIAARHYTTTRDHHFELATRPVEQEAAANPATNPATDPSTDARPHNLTPADAPTETSEASELMVAHGTACDRVENGKVGAVGFEPTKANAIRFTV